MVEIEALDFRYREGDFRLRVPELAVARGEAVAVAGPSGCGKTTFLHLLAGIAVPAAGRVAVDGIEVSRLDDAARRAFRVRHVGLVFQEFELLDYLSVLDNILLPYLVTDALTLDGAVRDRARALAEEVGLGGRLRRRPGQLSHGERQRVAVCRACVTGPRLLLADEPTGSLDPASGEKVLETLLDLAARSGATLVAVMHDRHFLGRFGRVIDAAPWSVA